jgi:hypothetical protein
VHEGRGTLRIGDTTEATMEPFRGPGGKPTTLVDSIYSTIPGSPAYLAKASTFRMKNRAVGVDVDLRDQTRSRDNPPSKRSGSTPGFRPQMQAASHRSRFLPLMAALTATAWLALWLWGQSPSARWLDHGSWAEIGVAGSLCRALPGGRDTLTGSLVVGGWVLMLSAMMQFTELKYRCPDKCRAPLGFVIEH